MNHTIIKIILLLTWLRFLSALFLFFTSLAFWSDLSLPKSFSARFLTITATWRYRPRFNLPLHNYECSNSCLTCKKNVVLHTWGTLFLMSILAFLSFELISSFSIAFLTADCLAICITNLVNTESESKGAVWGLYISHLKMAQAYPTIATANSALITKLATYLCWSLEFCTTIKYKGIIYTIMNFR